MSQTKLTVETSAGKSGPGKAFIKVVAYPWGVEFEMPEGEESK